MARSVSYTIFDQPDGRFGLLVLLGTRGVYARTGLRTLEQVNKELEFLWALMAAAGFPSSARTPRQAGDFTDSEA